MCVFMLSIFCSAKNPNDGFFMLLVCFIQATSLSAPLPELTATRRSCEEHVSWTLRSDGSLERYSSRVTGGADEADRLLCCTLLVGSFARHPRCAARFVVHWHSLARTETGRAVGGYRRSVEPPPTGQARAMLLIEFGMLRLQTLTVRGEDVELGFDDFPILGHSPLTEQELVALELRRRRAEMALEAKQSREEAEQQARQAALDALLEPFLDRVGEDDEEEVQFEGPADYQQKSRPIKPVKAEKRVAVEADGENAGENVVIAKSIVPNVPAPHKPPFSLQFEYLPVKPWLNVLSFLPAYADLIVWAHLSRGFYRGVHEQLQRRRAALRLRRLDAARLDEAFEHLGMFCADHLRQVTLTECAALCDTHLDTLSVGITALTALSIDACPSVTDDGLLPVLASHVRFEF